MTTAVDARNVLGIDPPETNLISLGHELYGWRAAAHHIIWAQALEQLERGEIKNNRLLIIAPPGHAKTNWGGIAFPSWYIGHHPNNHVLSFSATSNLSTKSSVAVRDAVETSTVWKEMFPNVKPDYRKGWSSNSWFVKRPLSPGDKDPTMFSTSVGSQAVLGARGDLLIFDDVSTQENTRTRFRREAVKEWIEQTAFSRATPNAAMLGIMTRWHTDDVAGYFEREHGFTVIVMPANGYWEHTDNPKLARMDEAELWPEHLPREFLDGKKKDLGPYKYTAMFQGNPTAIEGAIFAEEHFGPFSVDFSEPEAQTILATHKRALVPPYNAVVTHARESMPLANKYMVADTAYSEAESADYTVFALWGLGLDKQAYLLDIWRRRIDAVDLFDEFIAYWHYHKPDLAIIENKASGIELIQSIQRKTAIPTVVINPSTSKEERARGQAHVVRGAFHIPDPEASPEWVAEFLAEHVEFPRASHDDQVDTTSMIAEHLHYMVDFFVPEPEDQQIVLPSQVLNAGALPHPNAPQLADEFDGGNGTSAWGSRWGSRDPWMR